jgi:ABC-type antimicrobial peptide transport system permease subunit
VPVPPCPLLFRARRKVCRASQAAVWALAGVGLGLTGSLFAMRLLRALLFEVPERDPGTLTAAPVLLLLVALIAAWMSSRGAARVEPMQALRQE